MYYSIGFTGAAEVLAVELEFVSQKVDSCDFEFKVRTAIVGKVNEFEIVHVEIFEIRTYALFDLKYF